MFCDLPFEPCGLFRTRLIVQEFALALGVESHHALSIAQGGELMPCARAEAFRVAQGLRFFGGLRFGLRRRGTAFAEGLFALGERTRGAAGRTPIGRGACAGLGSPPRIKVDSTAAGGMSP